MLQAQRQNIVGMLGEDRLPMGVGRQRVALEPGAQRAHMGLLARAGGGRQRFGFFQGAGRLIVHRVGGEHEKEVAAQAMAQGEVRVGLYDLLDKWPEAPSVLEEVADRLVVVRYRIDTLGGERQAPFVLQHGWSFLPRETPHARRHCAARPDSGQSGGPRVVPLRVLRQVEGPSQHQGTRGARWRIRAMTWW